ncbi:hypothetical protein NDU88_006854 [Pleurodeles waltl]|uniref:Uncharacterized protein n=1 Tax=Pleurodeles waltl TaxID=8319 RepID=A0AAV7MDF4_PLEWA|nr:hypothetical protein NDU88_006854 [Pleurodeles waltl]
MHGQLGAGQKNCIVREEQDCNFVGGCGHIAVELRRPHGQIPLVSDIVIRTVDKHDSSHPRPRKAALRNRVGCPSGPRLTGLCDGSCPYT